jgi:hypothetical protein
LSSEFSPLDAAVELGLKLLETACLLVIIKHEVATHRRGAFGKLGAESHAGDIHLPLFGGVLVALDRVLDGRERFLEI